VSLRRRAGALRARLTSDGTLAGSRVYLNETEIRNVASIDLRITGDGAQLLVGVGHTVIDYGRPAEVDVRDVAVDLRPSPTPAEGP